LFVLGVIPAFVSLSQPAISHRPLLTAAQNQELEFTAVVLDTIEVTNVELYFRTSGTGAFSWLQMAGNGNYFSVRLPRQFVTLAGLDYYIVARDRIGRSATSPATAPTEFFEIMVRQDDASPLVLSRYPEDGDTVATARPVIRIGFYEESSIDTRRTSVFLDSVDVTSMAHILITNVSFTPSTPLAPGVHHVRIVIPDGSGNMARGASWSFVVKPAASTRAPLKLQLTPSFAYSWAESRPQRADSRAYSGNIDINAVQQIGDFTIAAHALLHTDQTLFDIHGRETARVQNLVISTSALPFALLWGNYSESFSELGLVNTSLKGVEVDASFGSVKTKGFSGTTTNASGNQQRFQGIHSRVTLAGGTSYTGFLFSGKDIDGTGGDMPTGFKPVHGTVIGVGSSLAGIPGSQLSFELARSSNNLSDVVRSADNLGYAGTLLGGTSLLGINLSTRVQYVDHDFHNPGNLFLQPNCLVTSTSASASLASFLSTSIQYGFTRRGINADTATVPTDESTASVQVFLTPLRIWNISTSIARSNQKSDLQTVSAKDAESMVANLSSSLFLQDVSITGGYSFSETQDRTIQHQSSRQNALTLSGSYRAGRYFSSSVNAYYSNSNTLASGVAADSYTATFMSTVLMDASGSNSMGLSATFNESLTTDGRSHTQSKSVQINLNSDLGLTMVSPPRVQCLFGWSETSDFAGNRTKTLLGWSENGDIVGNSTKTHQLQFNLSVSWNLNLSL
jgi:hypothetical protein